MTTPLRLRHNASHQAAFPVECLVVTARLDESPGIELAGQVFLLNDAERARRARMARADDRDRFTLGAVLLRTTVGEMTGTDPADVVVDRHCPTCGAQHGVPRLPRTGLHASISHSHQVAVVALTRAGLVGVDIEAVRPFDFRSTLSTVCSAVERPNVASVADYYQYWTRKEAVLKATGDGLDRPMIDVIVTPPGEYPALVSCRNGATPACAMADLELTDYQGAVAVLTSSEVSFTTRPAGRSRR